MGRRVNVIGVGMVKFQKPGASEEYDVMASKAIRSAIADAGVVLDMDGDACRRAAIVVGAAAPAPLRMHEAEAVLAGKPITEETARAAGKAQPSAAAPAVLTKALRVMFMVVSVVLAVSGSLFGV